VIDPAVEAETKRLVQLHYDVASEYYVKLRATTFTGLWRPGQEKLTKEQAQEALVAEIYSRGQLPLVPRLLMSAAASEPPRAG